MESKRINVSVKAKVIRVDESLVFLRGGSSPFGPSHMRNIIRYNLILDHGKKTTSLLFCRGGEEKGLILESLLSDFKSSDLYVEGNSELTFHLPWYKPSFCRKVRSFVDACSESNDWEGTMEKKREIMGSEDIDFTRTTGKGVIKVDGVSKYSYEVGKDYFMERHSRFYLPQSRLSLLAPNPEPVEAVPA